MDSSQLRDTYRRWTLATCLEYEATLCDRLNDPKIQDDPVWKDVTENALSKIRDVIREKRMEANS